MPGLGPYAFGFGFFLAASSPSSTSLLRDQAALGRTFGVSHTTIGWLRYGFCDALAVEPTTCRRPGRRMAGASSHPQSSHRRDVAGGGGTIQVGTIRRVAAN
jgi:hypothetical protein